MSKKTLNLLKYDRAFDFKFQKNYDSKHVLVWAFLGWFEVQ